MADGTLLLPDDFDESDEPAQQRFIGNYQLIRLIGAGAMGEVHLARHRQFHQRQCAIKLIRGELATPDARKRFEREIVAMGGLVHPNLVYAMDAGVDQNQLYLVMEYVAGRDLQSHLDSKDSFPVGQAAEILRQICAGVAHAHQQGVVHRDIKPANVLLSEKNEVKVLDLGIASLQSDAASRMTHGGSVMGTAPFIAPELWDDAMNASTASDVYAIGCTAYCLLTGNPPFSGASYSSLIQVMTAHRQVDPVPLHLIRSDVPIEFSDLIMRSLSKDRDRRFHNAAEFAEQLVPFCEPLIQHGGDSDSAKSSDSRKVGGVDSIRPASQNLESLVADSFGSAWWLIPFAFILMGLGCLALPVIRDFETPTWSRIFGQWDKPTNRSNLGLELDAIRLLFLIPVAWYVLSRYYPGELRRTVSLMNWKPATVIARVMMACLFGLLAYRVADQYWNPGQLPMTVSDHALKLGLDSEPIAESIALRWYSGYAVVAKALLPLLTLMFPIVWFLVGDLTSIRRRFIDLINSQSETSYAGRMRENLHRYGVDLRDRAGRILAVFFVASMSIHYDYWLTTIFAADIKKSLELEQVFMSVATILIALTCSIAYMTVMYVRGYEATSRATSICGTVKDVDDLSAISPGWLLRSTMFRGLSSVGYLSISLIVAHQLWVDPPWVDQSIGNDVVVTSGESPIDLTLTTPSWLPQFSKPAKGAELISIRFRGTQQRLYSEITISPPFAKSIEQPIEMVLVPQVSSEYPPSFYIMKRKVSTELFAAFEANHPTLLNENAAQLRKSSSADKDQPIYNVTGHEAVNFAEVAYKSKLPTPEQWDAAFGRYFRQPDIEACIQSEKPFPMVLANSSPWGCFEMGSQGLEFTRYDVYWRQKLPLIRENPHSLQLRGRSQFSESGNLNVEEWEKSGTADLFLFGSRPYEAPSEDISFRIVLDQD